MRETPSTSDPVRYSSPVITTKTSISATAISTSTSTATTMDQAFPAAIASNSIHGAHLFATNTTGSFTYTRLIGTRTTLSNPTTTIPLRGDDVLYLASATKLITTIAALQCVEDGLLTLDRDLGGVAPELGAKPVLTGFTNDGEPVLEQQKGHITLRQLLTHSSGLAYHFLDPKIMKWYKANPPASTRGGGDGNGDGDGTFTVEELIHYPLTSQPGEGWMYGPSLDWAGRIIERVSGRTLGAWVEERILSPLGFKDGSFFPVTDEDMRRRMADLNPDDPEGLGRAVSGGGESPNTKTRGGFGGHGLFMTGEGYLAVLKSLLANDGRVVSRETGEMMFENHLSEASQEEFEKKLRSPLGQFFRVGTEEGKKAGYGLGGLLTMEDHDGWYGEKTLTWGGGLTFAWFVDRNNDLCGVCAVQAKTPVDVKLIGELKQVFRKDIYRKKREWEQGS
jgi:CubicO group peptidase (beta-lactamase class C family)